MWSGSLGAESIRVAVVDDHPFILGGIKATLELETSIEVVGEFLKAEDLMEDFLGLKPDVVIMDLTMPGMSGVEATRHLRSLAPSCRPWR